MNAIALSRLLCEAHGLQHTVLASFTHGCLLNDRGPQFVAALAAGKGWQGITLAHLLVGVSVLSSIQLAGLVQVVKAAVSVQWERMCGVASGEGTLDKGGQAFLSRLHAEENL
jgi:hypothetical protein